MALPVSTTAGSEMTQVSSRIGDSSPSTDSIRNRCPGSVVPSGSTCSRSEAPLTVLYNLLIQLSGSESTLPANESILFSKSSRAEKRKKKMVQLNLAQTYQQPEIFILKKIGHRVFFGGHILRVKLLLEMIISARLG